MKENIEVTGFMPQKRNARSRRLPFTGTKNFRDLGGYRTNDGMTVRWGVLYRSDSLHKLTDADLALLASLNLGAVVDFRAGYETEKEPDILPSGVKALHLPMEDSSTKVWHEARDEMVRNMKTLDPATYMIRTNEELATTFTAEYARFYRELLSSNGNPILFHCAAGKDRTGFAAATLLRILGVDQETVFQDYLLTNRYLLRGFGGMLFMAFLFKGWRFFRGIYGFMKADKAYLLAAFAALEREHGSFENYVRNGLGLTDQDIERLKTYYLE